MAGEEKARYAPGDDAKAISRIANDVYGGYRQMFDALGWSAPGQKLMTSAETLIVERYGSIRAFEVVHERNLDDIWDRGYSVLFTSFLDWTPETWASIGWSTENGRRRRDSLLAELTDPFITVCAVTMSSGSRDPLLRGKVVGFYLTSHLTGDRDEFTHPARHKDMPDKWRHAVRALRAFTFLPEHRLDIAEFHPAYASRAVSVGAHGEVIKDAAQIRLLRDTPWMEVDVYCGYPCGASGESGELQGMVGGGTASRKGHVVVGGTEWLERELYILRLEGDLDAMLGGPADGRAIIKVGLAASPAVRRDTFQKALPAGGFRWRVDRSSRSRGHAVCATFSIAQRAEKSMKEYFRDHSRWLQGEFYLASEDVIDRAWEVGCQVAAEAAAEVRA